MESSTNDQESPKKAAEEDLSGYSSDTSLGNNSSDPPGSSDECYDASDESEEEDVGSQIRYLDHKRELLQRASFVFACEEQSYDASIAVSLAKRDNQKALPPTGLWKEAMDVLQLIGESTSSLRSRHKKSSHIYHNPPTTSRKRKNHPEIDVSSVKRMASHDFAVTHRDESIPTGDDLVFELLSNLPSNVFHEGQWMAQALVWSAPDMRRDEESSAHLLKYRWRMAPDPSTLALGLVPPSGMSMDNAVNLQEALSFSDEARVVTQAHPPFSIVYANKAFLILAGFNKEPNSKSSNRETAIGRPIESIIQVSRGRADDKEVAPKAANNNYLNGVFPSFCNKACRIRVSPVLDRSRRVSDSNTMSHILIQVSDSSEDDNSIMPDSSISSVKSNDQQEERSLGALEEIGLVG